MAGGIAIAAGGTGGHLFPGIAVGRELQRRDPRRSVVFVGTPRGLESRIVPKAGFALELLPILPLKSVGVVGLLKGLLALPKALLLSSLLVSRLKPRAVLGIGGYASGPFCLVAALRGVPTVILEPNARPGFTNRALRPFVRKAACAFEETLAHFPGKGVLTGNPVRDGFSKVEPKDHRPPVTLLVFGGSQGSRVLNEAVLAALPLLPGKEELEIIHQTGEKMLPLVKDAYMRAGREAEVLPFVDDMERRFEEADLVLCRSGATTCAELAAAGKASLLVPFERAADDHQRVNALALKTAGAAEILEEKDLEGASLGEALLSLVRDPARIAAMEASARRLGRPDAAARVSDLLEALSC